MKSLLLLLVPVLLHLQVSFGQDGEVTSNTIRVRKLQGKITMGAITQLSHYNSTTMGARHHPAVEWEEDLAIEYPPAAKDLGITGSVVVSFELDANGRAMNLELVKGVHYSLNTVALEYVREMPPVRFDGHPLPGERWALPFNFSLVQP